MRTIYKFPLAIEEKQKIEFLKEAGTTPKILRVGHDPKGVPCIWIELTQGKYSDAFEIHIVGTGEKISGCCDYVGSFVDGYYMWHVYV
jgi:hypothetical protein